MTEHPSSSAAPVDSELERLAQRRARAKLGWYGHATPSTCW